MSGKNLVIGIYSHPEYYPPTLNAVEYLSDIYDHIYIVHRNITGFDWKYPSNVTLLHADNVMHLDATYTAGMFTKVRWFLQFRKLLRQTIRRNAAHTVLAYDSMALFAVKLLYSFIKKPKVLWYHNHDVPDGRYLRKYSLSWWAWKGEKGMFDKLDLFSLPAMERRDYFPMDRFKGQFFFLPNFPSRKVYGDKPPAADSEGDVFRILFQGSIGPLHGLEEIIPLLPERIEGRKLILVLKGFISAEYLAELKALARKNAVEDQLEYVGPGGYRGVVENARRCHAGIGIHKKQDLMNKTLGTASNKIYEYAAVGMPVLVYDNEHFRQWLGGRSWVFFTDTSNDSLRQNIRKMIVNRDAAATGARCDFQNELCFETRFTPLADYLKTT